MKSRSDFKVIPGEISEQDENRLHIVFISKEKKKYPLQPILEYVDDWFSRVWCITEVSMVKCLKNCKQQPFHIEWTDWKDEYNTGPCPATAIIALQEGTKFELKRHTIDIQKGCIAVINGDKLHADSAYDEENYSLRLRLDLIDNH